MAYLQFEAMEVPRVKTKKSLAYIDHNMLQEGPENMDDHRYIQSVAKSTASFIPNRGNGICHQVQIERFGVPGDTRWDQTATLPLAAACISGPLVPAVWTWRWPWPVTLTISPCPKGLRLN